MVRTGGENNTTDEFRTVAVQDPIPIQVEVREELSED
jgi:hypothetical protein